MEEMTRPTSGSTMPAERSPAHPVALGSAALVVGVVVTAAGAGVGIRYLQKVGLSPNTVVGLALLVVGLTLLWYAGSLAWRGLRRWWRLVLVPVALVVLMVVFSMALGVMASVVPPTALGSGTPGDHGLTYREVRFETADDVLLSGWFVPSRNGAALVVRHGSGSTRTSTLDQAAVLGRHGYGLLLVDARGHGESGGRGMDLGWYGDQDVAAAVDFLADRPGVDADRIGLFGLSMGGEEVIGAAVAEGVRVPAVVAEGATARTAEDKDRWLPGGVQGTVQRTLDRLTFGVADLLTPASPPTALHDAVAGASETDFLLITAGQVPDETPAAEVLRRAAPSRVEVVEVLGASHTRGLDAAPGLWRRQVLAFLDARLQP
jgi:uncharacterized protein